MELLLIRHFPTPGNRLRQYIGSTDEALDREAIDHIKKKLGEFAQLYPEVDCVVASPMKRCVQTAKLLFPDSEILLCPEMRESDFGDFEGKTYDELKDHPVYQQWIESGGMTAFPNGESRAKFQKRCVSGMEKMMNLLLERGCSRAAVVVHGGTIMSVLSGFDPENREFYHWQVENGKGFKVFVDESSWRQGEKQFLKITKL